MLNLHPLECTIKDNDHIPDLLLIKYWGIISCKYLLRNIQYNGVVCSLLLVVWSHVCSVYVNSYVFETYSSNYSQHVQLYTTYYSFCDCNPNWTRCILNTKAIICAVSVYGCFLCNTKQKTKETKLIFIRQTANVEKLNYYIHLIYIYVKAFIRTEIFSTIILILAT